jgi:hypothetical protein
MCFFYRREHKEQRTAEALRGTLPTLVLRGKKASLTSPHLHHARIKKASVKDAFFIKNFR